MGLGSANAGTWRDCAGSFAGALRQVPATQKPATVTKDRLLRGLRGLSYHLWVIKSVKGRSIYGRG